MRLKLDENIDARVAAILREAGHEARTVGDQGLRGSPVGSEFMSEVTVKAHQNARAGRLEPSTLARQVALQAQTRNERFRPSQGNGWGVF